MGGGCPFSFISSRSSRRRLITSSFPVIFSRLITAPRVELIILHSAGGLMSGLPSGPPAAVIINNQGFHVTFRFFLSHPLFPRFQFTLCKHSLLHPATSQMAVVPLFVPFSTISAPDTPPQFLHARKLSDDEVELSWQPPLQANSDILYYFVRVW